MSLYTKEQFNNFAERPTEEEALERVVNRKAVNRIVQQVIDYGCNEKTAQFVVQIEVIPTREERNLIREKLRTYHALDVEFITAGDGTHITVQRMNRKKGNNARKNRS